MEVQAPDLQAGSGRDPPQTGPAVAVLGELRGGDIQDAAPGPGSLAVENLHHATLSNRTIVWL